MFVDHNSLNNDPRDFLVSLNENAAKAIVDEGSELNCIDASFAASCKLATQVSDASATAAGNSNIHIFGQSSDPAKN